MTTTDLTATGQGVAVGTWAIDPAHTEVGFTVRHLMAKVRGIFTDVQGAIEVADDPTASKVDVTVQMASIDTRNETRDGHLRTNDFFAIDQYPTMTFVATGLQPGADADRFTMIGDLTVRGVTKSISLDAEFLGVAEDHMGETRIGFEATGSINRKEFGVEGNVPLNGDVMLIGDQVTINLTVEAVHQAG